MTHQETNMRTQTTTHRILGVPQYDTDVDLLDLVIARKFMEEYGDLACTYLSRKRLEGLYDLWLSANLAEAQTITRELTSPFVRPLLPAFKKVLFAIANGMKCVRVKHRGQVLFWKSYQDTKQG